MSAHFHPPLEAELAAPLRPAQVRGPQAQGGHTKQGTGFLKFKQLRFCSFDKHQRLCICLKTKAGYLLRLIFDPGVHSLSSKNVLVPH